MNVCESLLMEYRDAMQLVRDGLYHDSVSFPHFIEVFLVVVLFYSLMG